MKNHIGRVPQNGSSVIVIGGANEMLDVMQLIELETQRQRCGLELIQ